MPGNIMKRRIRFLVLTLLAISPSHGYDLGRRIEEITGGEVRASPGSIYPILRELREEGLVSEESVVESGRLRKVYRLTRRGAEALYQQLQVFVDITNRILGVATLALKRLEDQLSQPQGEECPSEELLQALRRVERALHEYITALEERLARCTRGAPEAGDGKGGTREAPPGGGEGRG